MRFWAGVGLAGLIICGSISISAEAANIAPHRAVYELSLQRGSTSSDVVDVSGIMQFEWADACDGWAVTQRSVMTFLYQSGEEVELGWSLVSWEAKDGSRYRFFMRKVENGVAADELRGEARLEGAGKGGAATYSRPDERTVSLPPGTMFPTAHSIELLNRAEGGDRMLWASVFDGSDEEGLFGVNAVIMRRFEPKKAEASRLPLLTDTPSWSIRMAFFGNGLDATPEHEQSLRLHTNGVVEDLLLDYGDFSVEGELTELESLPDARC
ncbi:cell envelope integrity EipB family protein [Rhodospirillaceae bacterium SYSU D60014]|uniref:cell envelope integrity EipB family protein n=1 Tax=Virgifigura deserti TaxID=2268457 RepID=UPI000E661118